jgi:hypothetical protein
MRELGHPQEGATKLLGDNQGSLDLSNNPTHHSRTKHIDIRHHFIREAVEERIVALEHCPTEEMVADILTKALPREKFIKMRLMMGVDTQTGDSLSGSVEKHD